MLAAWDSLQNLGFSNPVSDFVSSIQNKTLVHDILEAEEKVSDFIDEFCEGPTFEDSEKVVLSPEKDAFRYSNNNPNRQDQYLQT